MVATTTNHRFSNGLNSSSGGELKLYLSWKRNSITIGGSRGGREGRTPPLGVQILSISCSFRENLACSRPPWRVHAPPRENPGSATDYSSTQKKSLVDDVTNTYYLLKNLFKSKSFCMKCLPISFVLCHSGVMYKRFQAIHKMSFYLS